MRFKKMVNFKTSDEDAKILRQFAQTRTQSVSELIREAIAAYILEMEITVK